MNNNIILNEDKKPKNWTALKPVRVICFVLIIAMAFIALNRFVAIGNRVSDTGLGVDIVLRDVNPSQRFFDQNMQDVIYYATTVARFESEESILARNHLIWVSTPNDWAFLPVPSNDFGQGVPMLPEEFYDEINPGWFEDDWYAIGEDAAFHRRVFEEDVALEDILREERRFVTGWHSQLMTPCGSRTYAQNIGEQSPQDRAMAESSAVNSQLMEFRRAMQFLANTDGLKYHISVSGDNVYANVAQDLSWFESQPVHFIMEDGELIASSHLSTHYDIYHEGSWVRTVWTGFDSEFDSLGFPIPRTSIPRFAISEVDTTWNDIINWTPGLVVEQSHATLYLAFTYEAYSAYRAMFSAVGEAFVWDFAIIGGAVLLALVLFAVLMVGAGRRFAVSKAEGVHFSGIDKPFLDISLAFVVFWSAIWLFVTASFINEFLRHEILLNIGFAVMSVVVVFPVLIWLMSLAKRIKAGGFWRHTLIYYIPRKLVSFLKPIWHGFKLMPKIAVISAAAFFAMVFIAIVAEVSRSGFVFFFFSIIITVIIAYFLTRYAKRLYDLEQAARKTSEGAYSENIDVGGGELGSIANSINNISSGIKVAVEERMKSERLKTDLITNVSHDIRTPLTSIITYTDLLKSEGMESEKAPEYLDILIQKSQRLKTLTDELFEAAKATTGNIDVNISELDIVSLINQVLGELDSSIESSGLDFRFNLPESKHVKADGKLMWRVLENLLSNVFKYSLPNSRVYIDVNEDETFVRVDIKNISNAELNIDPAELMDRFKRGDDSRADGGSGLGLSIVQSFVSAQGGKFEIAIDGDLFKASVFLRVES